MGSHEVNLRIEIDELLNRLERLKGRRVYKEDFEEEMRDIIDILHMIFYNNPIFHKFTTLVLPVKMDSTWFEDEAYEDEDEAKDMLKNLIKESERSCKHLLKYLDTAPKERKLKEVIKEPKKVAKPIIAPKVTKPEEKKTKDLVQTKITLSKDPSIESEFELSRQEYVIFLLGLLAGLFLGFLLGIILE